jgi:limonene 1,2-monooxygenase
MKFGVFMPPHHHPVGINPGVAYERDLEFIEQLDKSGWDEAWIGEHHSGGAEIYAEPGFLIAAAAQRTRHIMLGTGVVNLPLHHPLMVADRMVMLDHLTRGRAMLGVGSGALAADFTMMGLELADKRRMSEEALEAIVALLRAEGPVTMKTDWFELKEARLQLASYTKPHLPIAVAGSSSQDGSSASGRYGIGLISGTGIGGEQLPKVWDWFEESAQRHGREADRADWRVMLYFHIADTQEEALSEIRYGLKSFSGLGLVGATKQELDDPDLIDKLIERGRILVGTPDDAIETIEHLLEVSGGFGGFVAALYGLASPQNVLKSYDLMGRYVMPHFQGHFETVRQNREWVLATRGGPNGADTTGTPDGYYTSPVVRSRNGSH